MPRRRLHNPTQPIPLHLVWEVPRAVTGLELGDRGFGPDLEKVAVGGAVVVVFRVADSGAGGGELDGAAWEGFEVGEGVGVGEGAGDDVRPDEEF